MRRFILWDFPRGVWQYDVMVAAILAFIFLTPRDIFRDQPRASSVVMLPQEGGNGVFWIEPDLLAGVGEGDLTAKANQLLKQRTGKPHTVRRLEPIFDSEHDIKGYMAFTNP
jgi:hypothetical protein